MLEFSEFPKMARLNRECVITEKIDGTNAQIYIVSKTQYLEDPLICTQVAQGVADGKFFEVGDNLVLVGSRTRWITRKDDNYGFARWVYENRDELIKLGPGRHFGEWWGAGVQRTYDMTRKVFSLFNARQWKLIGTPQGTETGYTGVVDAKTGEPGPSCVGVVPILYQGLFSTEAVSTQIERLRTLGSVARPGYMDPEGLVVFHLAGCVAFKVTVKNDDKAKGQLS